MILNRTSDKIFGWDSQEEALGRALETGGHGDQYRKTIIGAIEDFHYQGLQKEIGALGMMYRPQIFRYLSLTDDDLPPINVTPLEREYSA